jgi:hypothetical protein
MRLIMGSRILLTIRMENMDNTEITAAPIKCMTGWLEKSKDTVVEPGCIIYTFPFIKS